MIKKMMTLVLALACCFVLPAKAVDIIWVSFHGADDVPSAGAAGVGFTEAPDRAYTDLLKANGYNVTRYVQTGTPDPAVLNAADLVIISRSVASGSFQNDAATRWNTTVTAPMIIVNGYTIRKNRMGFATGNTIPDTTGDITLTVSDPTHPIFAGIPLTGDTMTNPYAGVVVYPDGTTLARGISIVTEPANPEGTVLATVSAAGNGPVGAMVIAEWPAGATVTHDGGAGTDVLAGPRLIFLTGAREASGKSSQGTGMYDLYEDGAKMFLNAVAMYAPLPEPVYDVTSPGDTVKGVPNDGDWPAGEYPALAIDNRSGTKFLHRKGGAMPTGIAVTPSAGPTLVTGLSFTTANDAPTRDPIAYELSGSNVGIDGPWEVIAAGDIVDFAGAADWPRFTKNTTPIEFANEVVYEHYKIVFPRLRGATQTLMQIAEIELLGTSLGAFAPTPRNGGVGVPIDAVVSWSPGSRMALQDVYFGTEVPPALVASQTETGYDPGPLKYGTTYFWRVDTVKTDGSVQTGKLWSFTTTIPVGIFEYTKDLGDPAGVGKTVFEGYVWKEDILTQQYLIQAGGADIWGVNDQFHFAYNTVSGNVRISAGFDWVARSNQWAKYGVMLRKDDTGPSVNYCTISRRDNDLAAFQWRETQGAGSSSVSVSRPAGVDKPKRVGIQRVEALGLTWIQGMVDWGLGQGWEGVGSPKLVFNLPEELLVGVCVTSHDNSHVAQARAYDVTYERNPSLVGELGLRVVPAEAALAAPPSDVSGFRIHTLKPLVTDGWGYEAVRTIFDTGLWKGLPAMPGSEGVRIDQFVNLRDTGNGVFSEANGYPDASYPGIDKYEMPARDPADGDDDNNHGTEITACIQLTAGLHIIGANSDDGTIIEIGGVEIGRTAEWKGTSNVDFVFEVAVDGYYNLRALHMEGGGGSSIELHQVLLDGTRILLNDVARGGVAVFAAP